MSNYVFKQKYTEKRGGIKDYDNQEDVANKFEPIKLSEFPKSYSGNCYLDFCYDSDTKKVTTKKNYYSDDKNRYISFEQMMPSSHALYSLLCLYSCEINSHGPDGYKTVWSIGLRHKETGQIVIFREWKGGLSLGCSDNDFNSKSGKDIKRLLSLMVNGQILHPYDGTRAGCVA